MHFCFLPGSDFLVCACVKLKIRTSYHQLTSRHSQTLCRHCLNGKDIHCAALFHPHIYFSPSESSHKERKPQHLNSSNSFHLGNIEMSRSDADEICVFVFMISIFFSSPFSINELIYVFRKKLSLFEPART